MSREPLRRPLSREVIVETAMDVLRKDGIEGLSMRRLATELGTGPATLYAHVAHKEELVGLLFDEVAAEIPLPEPDAARWREQVTRLWVDTRTTLLRYRDIARASLGAAPAGPHTAAVTEVTMRLLRMGGVPDRSIAWAVDVVGLYVAASAVEGATEARRRDLGREPGRHHADELVALVSRLPAERFPTVVALLPLIAEGTDEERFRFGLELLVNGLAQLADE